MKNLSVIKIFVLAAMIIFPANVSAGVSVTQLNPMIGTWYNANGNPTLTIGSDYSINGCKIFEMDIISAGEGLTTYKVKILENTGYRDIALSYWNSFTAGQHSEKSYHDTIVIDNKNSYRRTKTPQYFESVGGIYLGMSTKDVMKSYGKPTSIDKGRNEWEQINIWRYGNNFSLSVHGDTVNGITIYKNGDRKFDKSGLSANSSLTNYKNFYQTQETSNGRVTLLYIGHGEVILLKSDSVSLESI